VPPVACSVWLYGRPTLPLGSEVVVMVGGVLMVIDRPHVALAPAPSVTLMTKVKLPALVGVPEMTPVFGSSVIPGGSAPTDTDQV